MLVAACALAVACGGAPTHVSPVARPAPARATPRGAAGSTPRPQPDPHPAARRAGLVTPLPRQPGEPDANRIGRATGDGAIREFSIPTPRSSTAHLVGMPDGSVWFAENGASRIGHVTPQGQITERRLPSAGGASTVAAAPDGTLWVTEQRAGRAAAIEPSGALVEYALPGTDPVGVAIGQDGAVWV